MTDPVLPGTADLLALHLPGSRRSALTTEQLAHRIFGVPVRPIGDVAVDRQRRTAIRKVQEAITELRLREVPVCASDDGLWRAETATEAFDAYRSLRSRALGQLHTAAAVKRAAFALQRAEQRVEQPTLWEAA